MKVLMVSDFYPPTIGGMEKEVQLLSEGLRKKGCDVSVCTLGHNFLPKLTEENGVKVRRIEGLFQKVPKLYRDPDRRFHPPIRDWLITRKLNNIVQEEKPDIIHTHGWIVYSALPLRNRFGIPLCVTFHDFGFIIPRRWCPVHDGGICSNPLDRECMKCARNTYGWVKGLFACLALRLNKSFTSDAIIFTNPNLSEKMDHLKQPKFYLPHAIDTDRYRPIETEEFGDRILCWVKLERAKGVGVIFDVAKQLREYQFDIPFVGADREHYRKSKPENVNLIPRQQSQEIPRLINSYPIVLGQLHVGVFGLSELEAMACGKPVIANWDTKYDRFYEEPCPIISGKNANTIVTLIKSNIGNKKIGRLSREWIVRNHSTSSVLGRLVSLYQRVSRYTI